MNTDKLKILEQNIIAAMAISNTSSISEGGLYWALFKQTDNTDEATKVVKNLVDSGKLQRNGFVFELSYKNGKKDSCRR